jgi:hypothetical protein
LCLFNCLALHCCEKIWSKAVSEDFRGLEEICCLKKVLSDQNYLQGGFMDFFDYYPNNHNNFTK